MADKNVEELAAEELEALKKRESEVKERAQALPITHEHIVMIHRYPYEPTFLELDERGSLMRRRTSWYGKVLKISPIDSGDDIIENKKKLYQEDDVIIFNPESAYSLNIAQFEEIWILHIDNILTKDYQFDYLKMKEDNIRKRLEIQYAQQAVAIQKAQEMEKVRRIQQKESGPITLAKK